MRAVAVVALLAGCWNRPDPTPVVTPPQQPRAGAYSPTAAFAVAIHESAASWANPPAFWPCPIRGATFLCGTQNVLAIHGDRVEHDRELEAGRAPGLVEAVAGSWPDDAWLVVRTETEQCGECHYVAHRWERDRWVRVAAFASQLGVDGIAAWQRHLFMIEKDGADGRKLVAFAPGALSPIARRVVDQTRCATGARLTAIAATESTLFVLGATCGETGGDVTRWTAAGPQVDRPVADSAALEFTVTATVHGDVSLHGSLFGDDVPVLQRFDGARWTARDVQRRRGSVDAYARAPDGTEWMIATNEVKSQVLARTGGDWQAIDGWRAATTAYGHTPRLANLWITEGSVWLYVIVEGECQDTKGCEYRTLLLRTGAAATSHAITRDRGT